MKGRKQNGFCFSTDRRKTDEAYLECQDLIEEVIEAVSRVSTRVARTAVAAGKTATVSGMVVEEPEDSPDRFRGSSERDEDSHGPTLRRCRAASPSASRRRSACPEISSKGRPAVATNTSSDRFGFHDPSEWARSCFSATCSRGSATLGWRSSSARRKR